MHRMTIADIEPKQNVIPLPIDVAVVDERRMTRRLDEWMTEQIKDGVSPIAVQIALETTLSRLKLVAEVHSAPVKK